jgi:transcriptional regulator with XRE-family HTH domain
MLNNPNTNNCVRSEGSQETLSDFVRRIRIEKRLSCADVSRQSARFGKRISGSYVNRLENYPQLKVSAHRLKALAKGLGIPVPELMARATGDLVAGGTSDDEFLLTRFRELSRERKDDVLKIVDLWYSERADSRCEREPALHSQFLTRLRKKGTDHAS